MTDRPMSESTRQRMKDYYTKQLTKLDNPKIRERASIADPKVRDRRNHIWKHNSYFGHVAMMDRQLRAMADSPSTGSETKHLARTLLGTLPKLRESLNVRIDP